jgi:hypothetical protein
VAAVVDRTKSTRATYAIYTWIRISRLGQPPHEEWSAEFNSGALHRVETPRDRVGDLFSETSLSRSVVPDG